MHTYLLDNNMSEYLDLEDDCEKDKVFIHLLSSVTVTEWKPNEFMKGIWKHDNKSNY